MLFKNGCFAGVVGENDVLARREAKAQCIATLELDIATRFYLLAVKDRAIRAFQVNDVRSKEEKEIEGRGKEAK